jgi:hypothetical protein
MQQVIRQSSLRSYCKLQRVNTIIPSAIVLRMHRLFRVTISHLRYTSTSHFASSASCCSSTPAQQGLSLSSSHLRPPHLLIPTSRSPRCSSLDQPRSSDRNYSRQTLPTEGVRRFGANVVKRNRTNSSGALFKRMPTGHHTVLVTLLAGSNCPKSKTINAPVQRGTKHPHAKAPTSQFVHEIIARLNLKRQGAEIAWHCMHFSTLGSRHDSLSPSACKASKEMPPRCI